MCKDSDQKMLIVNAILAFTNVILAGAAVSGIFSTKDALVIQKSADRPYLSWDLQYVGLQDDDIKITFEIENTGKRPAADVSLNTFFFDTKDWDLFVPVSNPSEVAGDFPSGVRRKVDLWFPPPNWEEVSPRYVVYKLEYIDGILGDRLDQNCLYFKWDGIRAGKVSTELNFIQSLEVKNRIDQELLKKGGLNCHGKGLP